MPSGIVISRSSVPVVRSRSIVIEVTRNITMNGKSPSSGAPICWNTGRVAVEDVLEQHQQDGRHDEQQRDRARVVAHLAQHARRRWRQVTAALIARLRSLDERQERLARGPRSPVSLAQLPPASSARATRPVAHQQQVVALGRLVHHVARDEQRRARRRRAARNVAQSSARSTGSRPTVGSSSTSSSGRPSSAVASETRERCPPDRRRDHLARATPPGRRSSITSSTRSAAGPEHARRSSAGSRAR